MAKVELTLGQDYLLYGSEAGLESRGADGHHFAVELLGSLGDEHVFFGLHDGVAPLENQFSRRFEEIITHVQVHCFAPLASSASPGLMIRVNRLPGHKDSPLCPINSTVLILSQLCGVTSLRPFKVKHVVGHVGPHLAQVFSHVKLFVDATRFINKIFTGSPRSCQSPTFLRRVKHELFNPLPRVQTANTNPAVIRHPVNPLRPNKDYDAVFDWRLLHPKDASDLFRVICDSACLPVHH